MVDQRYVFDLTKDRSAVNSKYRFEFIGSQSSAVVPVLQHLVGDGGYNLIGTASYICEPNIFITAKHIFEGDDIHDDDRFQVVLGEENFFYSIVNYPIEGTDISLFTVENAMSILSTLKPFRILNGEVARHEVVGCFGYSHSEVYPEDIFLDGDGEPTQPMRFRTKWELGGVLEHHSEGRGHTKGKCFETSVLVEGRDSGGPLFVNGLLVGVASSSFTFDGGLPNSVFSSVENILHHEFDGQEICNLVRENTGSVICRPINDDDSTA